MDKNYLLEQAQLQSREILLSALLEKVKDCYDQKNNPLGLLDSFSMKIRSYKPTDFNALHGFYENLAAVYRYKFGNNQLEFLWDGTDHMGHYQQAWKEKFQAWIDDFCKQDLFVQAVLDLTVFLPDYEATQMIENRMSHFVLKYFDVKIHKVKGLMVA